MAFPHNVQVSVNANPAVDNVSVYNFYVNGTLSVSQATPKAVIAIPGPGTYVFEVSASNGFGESPKVAGTLIASVPSVPSNIQVVVL